MNIYNMNSTVEVGLEHFTSPSSTQIRERGRGIYWFFFFLKQNLKPQANLELTIDPKLLTLSLLPKYRDYRQAPSNLSLRYLTFCYYCWVVHRYTLEVRTHYSQTAGVDTPIDHVSLGCDKDSGVADTLETLGGGRREDRSRVSPRSLSSSTNWPQTWWFSCMCLPRAGSGGMGYHDACQGFVDKK